MMRIFSPKPEDTDEAGRERVAHSWQSMFARLSVEGVDQAALDTALGVCQQQHGETYTEQQLAASRSDER